MSFNSELYKVLRVSRAVSAVRRGRVVPYLRRSLLSTLVAKLSAGVRR